MALPSALTAAQTNLQGSGGAAVGTLIQGGKLGQAGLAAGQAGILGAFALANPFAAALVGIGSQLIRPILGAKEPKFITKQLQQDRQLFFDLQRQGKAGGQRPGSGRAVFDPESANRIAFGGFAKQGTGNLLTQQDFDRLESRILAGDKLESAFLGLGKNASLENSQNLVDRLRDFLPFDDTGRFRKTLEGLFGSQDLESLTGLASPLPTTGGVGGEVPDLRPIVTAPEEGMLGIAVPEGPLGADPNIWKKPLPPNVQTLPDPLELDPEGSSLTDPGTEGSSLTDPGTDGSLDIPLTPSGLAGTTPRAGGVSAGAEDIAQGGGPSPLILIGGAVALGAIVFLARR